MLIVEWSNVQIAEASAIGQQTITTNSVTAMLTSDVPFLFKVLNDGELARGAQESFLITKQSVKLTEDKNKI